MTLFILMSVAQWEREAIGERTTDALAHLRAEGVVLGRAALGWRHAAATDPTTVRRVLEPVDAQFAIIERIQALRREGRSFAAIARQLADDSYPTQRGGRWLPNTVRRVWKRGAPGPADGAPATSLGLAAPLASGNTRIPALPAPPHTSRDQ